MTSMILFLVILMFILMFLGLPIYISLLLPVVISLLLFTAVSPTVVMQNVFGGIDKFVLMSLPFYILTANAMDAGGLSSRILRWARALVGHFHGGTAMTVQTASMFFGALSGSSPATVAAIGKIMYPELIAQKYPKKFSDGLIVQSGAISLVIPPSITLILFASATNTSVGALFMAGLSAGIIMGIILLIYIFLLSKIKKFPKGTFNFKELVASTKEALWSLGVPVIIILGIALGIFTPTEAAGVATLYALFVGAFIYKEINLKKLYKLCLSSAITSAQIMILIASASALGWILTIGQGPQMLAHFLSDNFTSAWTFFIFLNIILLILGMFLDASVALVVIAPLILGTATSLGIDPVHLGIVMVINLAIGTFTPPFGLNIFVANSVLGLNVMEMTKGVLRFLPIAIVVLILVTYIPSISTFLPNLFSQ